MPAQSPPTTINAGNGALLSGLFRPYEMLNSFMMSNLLMNRTAAARSLDPGFVPKDDLEEEEEEDKAEIDVD